MHPFLRSKSRLDQASYFLGIGMGVLHCTSLPSDARLLFFTGKLYKRDRQIERGFSSDLHAQNGERTHRAKSKVRHQYNGHTTD